MCAKDATPGGDYYAQLAVLHTSDGILVSDREDRTEWCNQAFTRMSGYALADIVGKVPGTLLHGPETDPATVTRIRETIRARQTLKTDIMNYTKAGVPYWVELRITPIFDADGLHTQFLSVSRDITERKVLEAASVEMREREAQAQHERKLFAQTSEWLYSAKSLEELLMVTRRAMHTLMPEANGALYVYGSSRDWLDLAASWGDDENPPRQITPDSCWALRRGRAYSYGTRPIEFPCEHAHDPNVPYFCVPIIAHGETIGLLHINFPAYDRTLIPRAVLETFLQQRWDLALLCGEQISLAIANVRLRQELHDQSMRDPLTNLFNRRWFLDAAARELGRARSEGHPVSFISLDVDHFKRFNDDHGHDVGDLVLRRVGQVLAARFGHGSYACRIGGEEFVILCPGSTTDEAAAAAESVRAEIAELELVHAGTTLPRITVSAGVASFPTDGAEALAVLKSADMALYRAKDEGRNRVTRADHCASG